jgi:hypothetical protein
VEVAGHVHALLDRAQDRAEMATDVLDALGIVDLAIGIDVVLGGATVFRASTAVVRGSTAAVD